MHLRTCLAERGTQAKRKASVPLHTIVEDEVVSQSDSLAYRVACTVDSIDGRCPYVQRVHCTDYSLQY